MPIESATPEIKTNDTRPRDRLVQLFNTIYPETSEERKEISRKAEQEVLAAYDEIAKTYLATARGADDAISENVLTGGLLDLQIFPTDEVLAVMSPRLGSGGLGVDIEVSPDKREQIEKIFNNLVKSTKSLGLLNEGKTKEIITGMVISLQIHNKVIEMKVENLGSNHDIKTKLEKKLLNGDNLRRHEMESNEEWVVDLGTAERLNMIAAKIFGGEDASGLHELTNKIENLALEFVLKKEDKDKTTANIYDVIGKMMKKKKEGTYFPSDDTLKIILTEAIRLLMIKAESLNETGNTAEKILNTKQVISLGAYIADNFDFLQDNQIDVDEGMKIDQEKSELVKKALETEISLPKNYQNISGNDILSALELLGLLSSD